MNKLFVLKYLVVFLVIFIGAVIGENNNSDKKYSAGFFFGYLAASIVWKL